MPKQDQSKPTLGGWKRLYQSAREFCELAHWKLLENEIDVFAVEHAETDEVAYCSVMGAGGQEFGLLAYRDEPGLLAHRLMLNDALDHDEAILMMDCLSFSLGNRSELDAEDIAVHKALDLRFRGRGAWPVVRSYRPGCLPARLNADEAAFLATCIEQTCLLAREASAGELRHEPPQDERVLVRRCHPQRGWETDVMDLPPPIIDTMLEAPRLEAVERDCRRTGLIWEARFLAVVPIEAEDESAYWARSLLCVDHQTGFIFSTSLLEREDSVQGAFLSAMEMSGFIPKTLMLTSSLLEAQLAPTTQALGIGVDRVRSLPELEAAAASLKRALGAGP